METFEIVQKLLAWGPTYEIRRQGEPDILAIVKGKLLTATPKLTMHEGSADGPVIAKMEGNFLKTKFTCGDASGQELGLLTFPLLALKWGFTVSAGGKQYNTEGNRWGTDYKCVDGTGQVAFTIARQPSLRDQFVVSTTGELPRNLALVAAIAVDQKFFQDSE